MKPRLIALPAGRVQDIKRAAKLIFEAMAAPLEHVRPGLSNTVRHKWRGGLSCE